MVLPSGSSAVEGGVMGRELVVKERRRLHGRCTGGRRVSEQRREGETVIMYTDGDKYNEYCSKPRAKRQEKLDKEIIFVYTKSRGERAQYQ
jgi:hypothetical protein